MSARRRSSRSLTILPGTDSIATSRFGSLAVNASTSGPMCSAISCVPAICISCGRPGRVRNRAAGLLGEPEDLRGERRQAPAAGGQRDPAPFANEQLVAELLAQRGDRHGDRRLGHAELGGGRLDRSQARDEHERLQLRERHLAFGLRIT